MKVIILLTCLLAISCQNQNLAQFKPQQDNEVIYGDDGRLDYFEMRDPEMLEIARSTVVLVDQDSLRIDPTKKEYRFVNSLNIPFCPSEKYAKQPNIGHCTGTLIGADLILTAGHCIRNRQECQSTRFMFDYRLESPMIKLTSLSMDLVYKCAQIIYTTEKKNAADFAIIRLDRPVLGRTPLEFSEEAPRFHQPLMIAGYPAGFPLKFTLNGQVRSLIPTEFFVASIDTFTGNSGSAVLDQNTKKILGVLARGEQDYDRKNSCYVAKECSESGCRGEDVTRVEVIKKYLPKAQ